MSVQKPKKIQKEQTHLLSGLHLGSVLFVFLFWDCVGLFFFFFWFLACGWVRMSSSASSSMCTPQQNGFCGCIQHLFEGRDSGNRVHVPERFARSCVRRPDATGSVLITDLPPKDLDPASSNFKHVLDLVLDIPAAALDMDTIKAIIRDKAWQELPDFMQMKERPVFECACQCFFLLQSDDKFCMLKHIP